MTLHLTVQLEIYWRRNMKVTICKWPDGDSKVTEERHPRSESLGM